MPNEEAGMRPIPVLLAIAAIVGGVDMLGADPADAQCSVFSRHPCVPGVCSVFRRHPCVPEPLYPFAEDLRLTIVSAASDRTAGGSDAAAGPDAEAATADREHRLDTE